MIVDERIVAYINSMNHNDRDIVATIEKEAIANYVPIIRKETKELLKSIRSRSSGWIFLYFYERIFARRSYNYND